jgi:hypothetical protein
MIIVLLFSLCTHYAEIRITIYSLLRCGSDDYRYLAMMILMD